MLKSNIEGEPMGVSPKRDAFARTKEFLFEPFNQYRNLDGCRRPTIEFLQWLLTLRSETGLVLSGKTWAVVKGREGNEVSLSMSTAIPISVLIHTHLQHNDFTPSLRDYALRNCTELRREFVVSNLGITEFWPIKGKTAAELEDAFQWTRHGDITP